MRTIQASEAKTKLLSLLDSVERGESFVITRHGKPIARIVPDQDASQKRIVDAIEQIRSIRANAKPVSTDEILAWRHEGHKR